jgi:uncharacterized iron-regulated protein
MFTRSRRISRRRLLQTVPAVARLGAAWDIRDLCSAAEAPPARRDDAPRCGFWIDLCAGEPIAEDELLDDLAKVRVVYLGERHSLKRHHDLQARIVGRLAARGVRFVLALEQMETIHQSALDRYAAGKLSFDELAAATHWSGRWRDYEQYKPVLEAARQARAPILALNARSETIRQVVRSGGVGRLEPNVRRELPAEMQLADPAYEKVLSLQMMVHASATPERLRPMIEAQIARDEAMAAAIASFLQSPPGKDRTAVVLCGSGHVDYGLGTPARVRRRMPGVQDRIVLLSESGDVELTPQERAISRPVAVTQGQLRELARPVADYLHATSPKADGEAEETGKAEKRK